MDLGGLGGKVLLTKAPTNVDYQCNPRLGHPKLLDCMNMEFQITGQNDFLAGPSNPVFIKSGKCDFPKLCAFIPLTSPRALIDG